MEPQLPESTSTSHSWTQASTLFKPAFPFLSFQEISERKVEAVLAQVISLCNFPKPFQLRHSAARTRSSLISPLDGRKKSTDKKDLDPTSWRALSEDNRGYWHSPCPSTGRWMGWGCWCAVTQGSSSRQRRLKMQHMAKKNSKERFGGTCPPWLRWWGSPLGEAQKGSSLTSPQGLPEAGCLRHWLYDSSSRQARRLASPFQHARQVWYLWMWSHTSSTTASPQVPVPSIPSSGQPPTVPPKYPGRAASWQPFTEKCVVAMWELWQQNAHRIPKEPQWNPNRSPTKRGRWVPTAQQNSDKKSPNNTQGHWGQRGCRSQEISAWSLWQGVSWIFLPKEVKLFCDTCAGFDGDSVFCGYQILLYHLSPMYPCWT